MAASQLFDAHVHADGLRDVDLETLAFFGVTRVLVVSNDGGLDGDDGPRAWLAQFERLLTVEAPRFKRAGIRPLFALGIRPARAPRRGFEELLHKLPWFLSDPSVVAIGGLHLRGSDEREGVVFQRQLELAAELRLPAVVAVSPHDPPRSTRQLVNLVRATSLPPERVLVEGAAASMLPLLRFCRFQIALEPSPGRLSYDDIVRTIRQHGSERLMLSSHAGEGAADLLAVPAVAARLLEDEGVSGEVVARVGRDNALRFLGRDEERGRRRAI